MNGLPELPAPYEPPPSMFCAACGRPYNVSRATFPMAGGGVYASLPMTLSACECGSNSFKGTIGGDQPVAAYTATQMHEYATASLASAQQRIEELERALGEQRKAVEFAEYMAKRAEQLLEAIRDEDVAREAFEEHNGADNTDETIAAVAFDEAQGSRCEMTLGLHRGIYEFRKRAERCASDRNPQGGDASAAPGRSPESAVATATRPSKGFLKGESPQATWPFEQDDKGSSKSSEP